MILSVFDFLTKYWKIILLWITIISIIVVFIAYVHQRFSKKVKSFKQSYNDTKLLQVSVTIDLEENVVEKHYLYDQIHKDEIVSLDEFFVRFDKTNAERFKNWLYNIAQSTDFNKTRRIEVVMYDNNSRGVYLVELEGYNDETKRYYLIFKDTTESINVFKRTGKITPTIDIESFYNKANERLSVVDEGANNFLVVIKYKERPFAEKELPNDVLRLVEETIYARLDKMRFDNDLISLSSNGSFIIFSANVVNVKKYRQHIRKMLIECSGVYNLIQNRFSYTISLIAGYTKVHKEDGLTIDKSLEAETAANVLMNKGRFSERLQLFDENLQNIHTTLNNKLMAVEKVITHNLISTEFVPIITVKDKTICGYNVNVVLPTAMAMDMTEFMELVKKRSFRLAFYTNVFEQVLAFTKSGNAKSDVFYFSFDFDNIGRVMEAYNSNEAYSQIKFYFCVEFSNITMQNTDLITIEKTLSSYIEGSNVKFGISYNTLTTIYLNAKIYSKADVVLLSGQLMEQVLEKYTNETLIDVYTQVASSYHQEVIGLNVKSLALYEIYKHYKVEKVGGSFLTPYVEDGKISDNSIIKALEEIENKSY